LEVRYRNITSLRVAMLPSLSMVEMLTAGGGGEAGAQPVEGEHHRRAGWVGQVLVVVGAFAVHQVLDVPDDRRRWRCGRRPRRQ
jgi:hypothetical protein